MRWRATLLAALLVGAGCGKGTQAPVVAEGSFLTYTITQRSTVPQAAGSEFDLTVTLRKQEGGFLAEFASKIEGVPEEQRREAQETGPQALSAELEFKATETPYFLRRLWLPSSSRRSTRAWNKWEVAVLPSSERGVGGEYYFDAKTGFLVGYSLSVSLAQVQAVLKDSNIMGL